MPEYLNIRFESNKSTQKFREPYRAILVIYSRPFSLQKEQNKLISDNSTHPCVSKLKGMYLTHKRHGPQIRMSVVVNTILRLKFRFQLLKKIITIGDLQAKRSSMETAFHLYLLFPHIHKTFCTKNVFQFG